MLTTSNNNQDILFDDVLLMHPKGRSGTNADNAIQYGDCGNRFETEPSHIQPNNSKSKPFAITYGDCGN